MTMIRTDDDYDRDLKGVYISIFTFCYCVIDIDCHIVYKKEYDLHYCVFTKSPTIYLSMLLH